MREIPAAISIIGSRSTKARAKWVHAGHTLLHDLKENVVTPYVMVESLGWFYGLPIFGKTLVPSLYRRWTAWLRRLFVPSIATTLTVDKLAPPTRPRCCRGAAGRRAEGPPRTAWAASIRITPGSGRGACASRR